MAGWANTQAHANKVTAAGTTGASVISGFTTSAGQVITVASLYVVTSQTPTFSDTSGVVSSFAAPSTVSDATNGVTLGLSWGISAGGTCTPKVTWGSATSGIIELYAAAFTTPGGTVTQDGTTGTTTGNIATVVTPTAVGTTGVNDLIWNIMGFGGSYVSNGASWTPSWGLPSSQGAADASTGDFGGFAINVAGNTAPNVTQSPAAAFSSMTLALRASGAAASAPTFPVFLPRRLGPNAVGPTFFAALQPAPAPPPAGNNFVQTFTAALSFAGNVDNATTKALTAALSFTGGLLKSTIHMLAAALAFVGSIAKATVHLLPPAVLSFTGSTARTTAKSFTAGLSFAGAITRNIAKKLTAGLSFTGALLKSTVHQFAAGLSFTGTLAKNTTKTLTGALSFAGSFAATKIHQIIFTAALGFSGAVTKSTSRTLTGGLSFTGAVRRATIRTLTAGLSFTGSLVKNTTKTLAGALSFAGSLAATKIHQIIFTAALGFSGAVTKSTTKTLAGGLTFAGSLTRKTAKAFTATVGFSGRIAKSTVRKLTAGLSFVGNLITTHIGPSNAPPTICYPTSVLIVPYASAAGFAPRESGVTMRPYTTTTTIPARSSSVGIAPRSSVGSITGHDTAGTLVIYTSGVTHFNTCSD